MHLLTANEYSQFPSIAADARIPYGDDPSHFGDLFLPRAPGPHPVAVLVHGGCWQAQYGLEPLGLMARALADAGLAVWSLEYRRLGDGGGWPGSMLDVAAGADRLRHMAGEHQLDLTRVITVGHSAGGHLALWLAARHRLPAPSPLFTREPQPIARVVALAGIPDLVGAARQAICGDAVIRLLGGEPETHPDRYAQASPVALAPLGVPHVHIVGDRDHVIPLAYAEESVAAAARAGDQAELLLLANCGHFEVVHPFSTIWPLVMRTILTAAGLTVK